MIDRPIQNAFWNMLKSNQFDFTIRPSFVKCVGMRIPSSCVSTLHDAQWIWEWTCKGVYANGLSENRVPLNRTVYHRFPYIFGIPPFSDTPMYVYIYICICIYVLVKPYKYTNTCNFGKLQIHQDDLGVTNTTSMNILDWWIYQLINP